jgi:undecaprenyl-phosphate galactose phosphotransferase
MLARGSAGWHSKRLMDVVLASVLVVVLAPLLVAIAVIVATTSSGPVLYRRRVVGLGGVEFDAFKFRTMVADADEALRRNPDLLREFEVNFKLRDDPRVTTVGNFLRRCSLDELPQLFNVLIGQMSLVGPRMIVAEEMPRYGDVLARRLEVRPGITGLWQVSGRQEGAYEERARLDFEYLENWSLLGDVAILLKTIPAVLQRRGAY